MVNPEQQLKKGVHVFVCESDKTKTMFNCYCAKLINLNVERGATSPNEPWHGFFYYQWPDKPGSQAWKYDDSPEHYWEIPQSQIKSTIAEPYETSTSQRRKYYMFTQCTEFLPESDHVKL